MPDSIALRRYRFRAATAHYRHHTGHMPPRRVLRTIWRLSLEP